MTDCTGRFAPTPSGRMHLGNLLCALLAWLSARAENGRMVLRVEDLDAARSRPQFIEQLEEDLLFLGLDWDEGGSKGGPSGPYYQSRRTELYQSLLDRLEKGGYTYPCFCTRAELRSGFQVSQAPHITDREPVYGGRCRSLTLPEATALAKERSPALRLRVPDETIRFTDGHYGEITQDLEKDCGDFILRRSDGVLAYQLAVVADDALMGVTQVVRGRDLLSSTPRQLLLYRLLGFQAPAFYHLPLLLAPDGRRLSKREQDLSLDALRDRGYTPEDLVGRLAYLAGLLDRPEPAAPRELIPVFNWDKIPLSDIRLPENLFAE